MLAGPATADDGLADLEGAHLALLGEALELLPGEAIEKRVVREHCGYVQTVTSQS